MENELEMQAANEQNTTGYKPTAKESAILEILLNPENRMKSITEKCKLANCSRTVWYDALQKPEFVQLYKEAALNSVKGEIYPLIEAGIREAKRGSYQHWKTLLQMAGMVEADETAGGNVILIKIGD